MMTPRQRLNAALNCQPLDRPPIWFMRQAGRYLPEYRALKERYSFVEMVRIPELAAEVTMQPLRRFPLDAAILFSDILIVPEALGQGYQFRQGGGIAMDYALGAVSQLDAVSGAELSGRFAFVDGALRAIRQQMGDDRALLGFGGSPWTLAAYMIEGGSSDDFRQLLDWYYRRPAELEALLERITDALVALFEVQIAAGVDAIQIFDSWAAICPGADYAQQSLRWIRRLIGRLPAGFPIILFAKGMAHHAPALVATGARALSFDQSVDLAAARRALPVGVAAQGNLDPVLLTLDPQLVRGVTQRMVDANRSMPGHIFNLGHGITPDARIDCVEAMVSTVVGAQP
jgi:uroporphyrinogen decarboxylase